MQLFLAVCADFGLSLVCFVFTVMYMESLQAEAELAQQTPGRIASSSTAGCPVIIPRLPHNPTRVDRLYVESLREHSKVCGKLFLCSCGSLVIACFSSS